jgi:hypothetical protein
VRVLVGHQELGGLRVGLERIGGDHDLGKVEPVQQWGEGGDLLGGAADLTLCQHRAAGMLHRRQQVQRAAVTLGWVGAAQRFAVDGHGPPPAGPGNNGRPVPVGQPGADGAGQRVWVQAGQGAADGGLGRDGEVVGGVAAGAERGTDRLRGIGGPFGDRGQRAGAGQYRGGAQGEDGDQGVAAATGRSRVGDGGEVGQQVRGVGVLQLARIGLGEVGERGWDRG